MARAERNVTFRVLVHALTTRNWEVLVTGADDPSSAVAAACHTVRASEGFSSVDNVEAKDHRFMVKVINIGEPQQTAQVLRWQHHDDDGASKGTGRKIPPERKLAGLAMYAGAIDKGEFHRTAMAVARKLAVSLGIKPDAYDIRINPGGPAVVGEVTLHTEHVYVQFGGDSSRALGVLVRTCAGRSDYCGGRNRWWSWEQLRARGEWGAFVEFVRGVSSRG